MKSVVKLDESFVKLDKIQEELYILIDTQKNTYENLNFIKVNEEIKFNRYKESVLYIENIEKLELNEIKKIVQKISSIIKENHIKLGTIIDDKKTICIIVTEDKENRNVKDIIKSINACLIKDKYNRYEYLYDEACEYLDNEFTRNNYCDFKDNVCIAKRNLRTRPGGKKMGCCYNFNKFGVFGKKVRCEYLGDKGCTAKCIGCKLMTCDYIKVKFKIKNIILLDCFFNVVQKLIIKMRCFTPKEKIMKELMFWSFFN